VNQDESVIRKLESLKGTDPELNAEVDRWIGHIRKGYIGDFDRGNILKRIGK
jgi:hypothetical protein